MSRTTLDTKCRLCKAEGAKLYLKGARCLSAKCPIEKKGGITPGMHGLKRRRKPSDYGVQLRAKQKAKRLYGVQERQFHNYYLKAQKLSGLIGENLVSLLERRLDNVVYISGLSLSKPNAKQLVSHRHVLVNGKPLNINSYSVKVGDIISLDDATLARTKDDIRATEDDFQPPTWLELDKSKMQVKVASLPKVDPNDLGIDVNLIIEYYSR